MNNGRRNYDILKKMIGYCDRIADAKERFGNSLEALERDVHYKDAAAMCVLQIGELAGHLSDDFRAVYNGMPWREMKNMHNIAAHRYGDFSVQYLWDTIDGDIPALRDCCAEIVCKYEVLEQDCIEEPDEDMDEEPGIKMEEAAQ